MRGIIKKELMVFLLIFCCLSFVCSSQADSSLFFGSFSDDDLVALDRAVHAEIERRGLSTGNLDDFWYSVGLGAKIPKVSLSSGDEPKPYGGADLNFENNFSYMVANSTKGDFAPYVSKLKEYGFVNVIYEDSMSYYATDENGVEVHVDMLGDVLCVDGFIAEQ